MFAQTGFHIFIVSSYHNFSAIAMRSPYDALMYTILSKLMANSLGVEVGQLFYSIAHAHIYENQFRPVLEVLKRDTKGLMYKVEISETVKDVIARRDDFVDNMEVPGYVVTTEDIFKVKVVK